LGLAVVADGGRLLAPATIARTVAATSSFYDWAISAVAFAEVENPLQRQPDPALARTSDRHAPATGRASRQVPIRRAVRVQLPRRLPRPLDDGDVALLLGDLKRLRDLAFHNLLMQDGGLRPGEALGLHLADIACGRRRVVVRKRDDHPGGVRQKSRQECVVDLHEPRTLDAVSRYCCVLEVYLCLALARMVSASLVQMNGAHRSFQPSMKARMAALRSRTESNVPRRIACLVMIPKKISTMFSHEPEVGVKCNVTRGFLANQATT